jgi:hypothetical protein
MKNALLTILLTFSLALFGQNKISFTGKVQSEYGTPLKSANLMVFNKGSKKMETYGITDDGGRFKLRLQQNTDYIIKTSFIGFQSDSLLLSTNENEVQKTIELKEQNATLGEIELVEDIPILVKGDSIVYHAEDFMNGTERKLEDILENLPGVEITDEGEVEIEGKKVQKVLVEGKEFFDGDSKIAVENIPSDAVSKIEVLKNFSDVKQLKNVRNNQDNIALNIKLKEGKKNFWFGELSTGVGYENRYIVNPKLFYYSPKLSVNVLSNFNNNGEIPFTRRDFYRFTGGFKQQSNGTNLSLTSDNLGFSGLKNNKAEEIKTDFAGLNVDYSISEKLQFNSFFIYSGTKTDIREIKTTTFLSDNQRENSTTLTQQENKLGLGKMSLKYIKDDNFQVNYNVFGKVSTEEEDALLESITANINNTIEETRTSDPKSLNQQLNIYKTFKNQDVISLEANHYSAVEHPFYSANFLDVQSENQLPFHTLFPYNITTGEDYSINQNREIRTNKTSLRGDYYWVLSRKNNFTFSAGNTYSQQKFNSDIFGEQNGVISPFNESSFKNDIDFSINDLYGSISYRHLLGKLLISPSLTYHQYHINDKQEGETNSTSSQFLSPNILTEYRFKDSETLRLSYNRTANFADVYSYINNYVLNNYRNIYQGNNGIKNGIYDTYSLNYSSFSFYNGTSVNARLSYNKVKDAVKNNFVFNGINAVSSIINSTQEDESITLMGRMDKTIGKVKINLRTNLNYSNNYNTLKDKLVSSNSFTQSYRGSVRTNLDKGPNFEIGYQHRIDAFDNNGNEQTYITYQPFVELEWRIKEELTLQADYNLYRYAQRETVLNTYDFLNGRISYQKKDSPWEWTLGLKNILNNQSINSNSFSDNASFTTEYYVQPRMFMFNINYRL